MQVDTASMLISTLSGVLLRTLSVAADQHYQGLSQAARSLRQKRIISNGVAKKLMSVDVLAILLGATAFVEAFVVFTNCSFELCDVN